MKCRRRKQGLRFIFALVVIALIQSTTLVAQSQPNEKDSPVPLEQVIELLEEQYQVYFNYKSTDVADISIAYNHDLNKSIEEALESLSLATEFKFELTNEKYVIVHANNKLSSNKNTLAIKNQRSFRGIIKDAETQEPIQYSNIFYKNHQRIGTLSEPSGRFVLRKIEHSDKDTLVFNILGYETKYIPISSLKEHEIEVELHIQAYELDEVSIVDNSYIKELLIKAVENISKNYPNQRHRLTGYFQETSITQGEYSHFLESYLTVENYDYRRKSKLLKDDTNYKYNVGDNRVLYHQVRRSDDTRQLPNHLERWLGGSIHELLRTNFLYEKSVFGNGNHTLDDLMHDLQTEIKNEYLVTLIDANELHNSVHMTDEEDSDNSSLLNSRFYSLGEHYRDSDTLVTVGIKYGAIYSPKNEDPVFTGVINFVINKTDYAIEKIIRASGDEIKEKWNDTFKRKSFAEIQYRKIEGKYYPSLINKKIGLKYNQDTKEEISTTRFIVQKVYPDRDEFVKIKPSKSLKRRYRLIEKNYKYDAEFWDDYEIPHRMEAPLALKLALTREAPLEEQFKQNQKKNF